MTPEQGVSVFGPLLRQGRAQVGVMPFDYAQWARFYPASAGSPFFAELAVGGPAAPQAEPSDGGLRASLLAEEAGPRRRSLLESYLREQVAHVLKLSPARVETHKPFGTYGLDSLMALEFRNRLEAGLNLKLSATMVWNHPTVAALAPHVASKLGVELEAPAPAAVEAADGDAAFEALLDELKELPSAEVSRIIAEGA
jgi:acyl carrier protein